MTSPPAPVDPPAEILSAEEAVKRIRRATRYCSDEPTRCAADGAAVYLADSHEALRAALAASEADRDAWRHSRELNRAIAIQNATERDAAEARAGRLAEALEQIGDGWVPSESKGPGRWGVSGYIAEYAREALASARAERGPA